ncbi:hypothetical protein [Ruminococcus sp.]|uniref:hypothetical protein n=1 Tax=Ruminococcus sp. TaxID=41978 RepID=UPI0025FBE61C|nr:hypothetical protein [Ruminococcus sp.]MBQ8966936.1 hypothetical protein [Ruminococcus sp.]
MSHIKYKDAYPIKCKLNSAKSITDFGIRRFGNDLGNSMSFIVFLITKLLNKACVWGTIIFGVMTIINIFSMGISLELLHTRSLSLLGASLAVGVVSYIISGIVG